jgi:hypothetical protein
MVPLKHVLDCVLEGVILEWDWEHFTHERCDMEALEKYPEIPWDIPTFVRSGKFNDPSQLFTLQKRLFMEVSNAYFDFHENVIRGEEESSIPLNVLYGIELDLLAVLEFQGDAVENIRFIHNFGEEKGDTGVFGDDNDSFGSSDSSVSV